MQQEGERREGEAGATGDETIREQQPGEGGTTRFGMEEGDNTDTPATGGPTEEDEGSDGSSDS
jgi:hypothetical protein